MAVVVSMVALGFDYLLEIYQCVLRVIGYPHSIISSHPLVAMTVVAMTVVAMTPATMNPEMMLFLTSETMVVYQNLYSVYN